MRALAALLLVLTPAPALAAAAGVSFRSEPLAEVLKEAKARKLKVFVDVYATWCGPCHRLDAQVFAKPDVAAPLAKDWIAVKIDGEKGEGPEVSKKYHVVGYPTVLFLDGEGAEIDRVFGELPADEFVATAGAWAKGEKTLAVDEAAYFSSHLFDAPFASQLAIRFAVKGDLDRAIFFRDEIRRISGAYGNLKSPNPLWGEPREASRPFVARRSEAAARTLDELGDLQRDTVLAIAKFGLLRGAKAYGAALMHLSELVERSSGTRQAHEALLLMATAYHGTSDDKAAKAALDKWLGDKPDAHACNAYAWWTFQNKTFMDDGLKIAKKGLELDPKDDGLWDTLAELQFATGHASDAVASEQKALALNPDEAAYYKSQIEKFSGKN